MRSVKLLHCADLHIGTAESTLGTKSQIRQAETLITFEKIIDIARENAVDIMLIAGDLFNSNLVDKAFFNRVFECFNSIPNTKIVYAAGNHDPLNAESPFKNRDLPKNLFVMDTKDSYIEFADLNTRVYGKSFKEVYMQGVERFSLSTNEAFINLMCIHGELKSDLSSNYNSITADFIKNSGMDYIALGHIHKRTDIEKIGNTYFSYCGCPEGQGFDELGEKGIYLGTVNKNTCELKFVPTAKRIHVAECVDVSGLGSSNEIADTVISLIKQKYPDTFSDNLYKITLIGNIDDKINLSLTEIASRLNEVFYFAKLKDKTDIKIDFNTLSQENTLKGIFVKKMLSRIENATEGEKDKLKTALNIGLKAFGAEVTYNEN